LPVIYMSGEKSTDYEGYWQGITKGDLNRYTTVPQLFGSMRNTFTWRSFQFSFLINFKANYFFRRKSMLPGDEYLTSGFSYHMDYFKRWKKPGDERYTVVPRSKDGANTFMAGVYEYSGALITKGDFIRLQDVNLTYRINRGLNIFMYARNLGILWRANRNGIDPDYANADYYAPRTVAMGIQMEF